ncbi:MAG TPA: VWA domain-containing protein [Pyrinomonadaceae bacterium]|nr:VWA domain-containing protein [Pyrinomonadaceae bacterium]
MRKFASAALLLSLLLTTILYAQAQTRPRRVGQSSSQQQQQPQPATQDEATPAPSPRRKPVLQTGTTISSSGSQPAPQSSNKSSTPPSSEPEELDEGDVVRVNTTLVSIPVTVMDRNGRFIPNLSQQDFRVYEDGVEQQVAYFASVEKPFTVALVIDTSASTRFRLEEIQEAAFAFINQLRPDDRVLVVSFDEEVRVLAQATNDRARLREAISRVRTGGGTKLYDAMDLVINRLLSREQGRKAVVLFTDGVDTTSTRASYQSNVRDAEELDALIYPIQYDTSDAVMGPGGGGGYPYPGPNRYPYPRRRRSSGGILGDILGGVLGGGGGGGWPGGGGGGGGRRGGGGIIIGGGGGGTNGSSPEDYRRANSYLNDLAYKTGARVYRADTTRDLSQSFALIAEELRRQYSIGYYPKDVAQAGQRRQIRVRVNRPDLVVRARDSYIAGSQPGDATAQQRTNTQQTKPELRRFPLAGTR